MERLLARLLPLVLLSVIIFPLKGHAIYSPVSDTELPAATQISADNNTAPTAPAVYSYQMCFDGTNWDRCSGNAVDTELPVASTLADNTANPSLPGVAAYMMCFDGTNWDRCLPGLSDTDDNNVSFSQVTTLAIDLMHMSNGANWIRLFGDATNGLTIDQANTAQADYDTGGGTVLQTMIGIALPASGGPVAGGTVTNPFSVSGSMTCSNCSGTGVSVNEDVASANADPGTPAYSVRQTTLSTTTSADGDYQPLKSNDNGELYTSSALRGAIPTGANVIGALSANQSFNLTQLAGSSVQQATNAMNTTGGGLPVMQNACQLDVTAPTATTENQFGNVRCSSIGELYNVIRDAAGNARGANVTAANELLVSLNTSIPSGANTIGNVTIGGTPPGTAVEDAAENPGQTGVEILGVRRDAPVSSCGNDGDMCTFNFSSRGALYGQNIAGSTGGATPCYITTAASTNSTNCKGSAASLYHIRAVNTTATLYYLRLYNSSSAPTCSSATGFVETVPIPASTTGAGITDDISVGAAYGTGLGFCVTGGGSSTDNTNAATGLYISLAYN